MAEAEKMSNEAYRASAMEGAEAALAILARLGRGPASRRDLRLIAARVNQRLRTHHSIYMLLEVLRETGFHVTGGPEVYELVNHPLPDRDLLPAAYSMRRELHEVRERLSEAQESSVRARGELEKADQTRIQQLHQAERALDAVFDVFGGPPAECDVEPNRESARDE